MVQEAKVEVDKCHCYDRLRSVGRNLERQIPSFPWHGFVLIWDYTSGFLQYFPLTEGKIWKTARCKTTVSTQPNPEACDLLVAYFRELKGRSRANPKRREFCLIIKVCLMFFHLAGSPFSKTMCILYMSSIHGDFFSMGKMREVRSDDITPPLYAKYKRNISH